MESIPGNLEDAKETNKMNAPVLYEGFQGSTVVFRIANRKKNGNWVFDNSWDYVIQIIYGEINSQTKIWEALWAALFDEDTNIKLAGTPSLNVNIKSPADIIGWSRLEADLILMNALAKNGS